MIRKILFCAVIAGVFAIFTVGLVLILISAGQRGGSDSGPRRGAVPSTRVANLLQSPATRLDEARRLGRAKDRTSVHLLSYHAWKAEDGEFRRTCIWALGEIGDEKAVQPLSTALDSGDTETRIAVTRALRQIGGERAALFLAQAAVRQREAAVREAAAAALAGMQGPEVDVLLASAASDKDADVRLAAVQSLMGRKSRSADGALTSALRDDDARVRSAAAECLKGVGAGPLANARAVFGREYREGDLLGVVNLLEKMRTVEIAPVLVEALDRLDAMGHGERDEGLPARAGHIFAVQGEAVIGPLEKYAIAADCSLLSKRAAGEACALIGQPAIEPVAKRILKWKLFPNPEELRIWVRALGRTGHPDALPALDRAQTQQFYIPGLSALVAEARAGIETAAGSKLPPPPTHGMQPATGPGLPAGVEHPKLPYAAGDLADLRWKFWTRFGRAFYLKAAESWDPVTLGMMCELAADRSYATKMTSMLKAGTWRENAVQGADGNRTALKVNDVTGFDQAWCAAAFATVPDEWKPGVLWLWNNSAGVTNPASTGKVFEGLANGWDQSNAFVNYPLLPKGDAWAIVPVHPSKCLPLVWKAPKFGYYCFRNGWLESDDVVAQVFTREKDSQGPNHANAGAFRIFGLGHPWVAGPTGVTGFRAQEPCVVLGDDGYNERACGRVTHLETKEDGSGAMTVDLSEVYGGKVTGLRALAFDYSGRSGAPAMVVLVDVIRGGGERLWLWHLPERTLDDVRIEGNTFSISQKGASMKATFIAPAGVEIEATRDMVRAGELGGPNGLFEGRLDRVKATAAAGESFFVVITLQRGDPPKMDVDGEGLDAKVRAGMRTVGWDRDRIRLGDVTQ